MNRHLSDESLLSLAQGGDADGDRAHLSACGRCAERVEEARAGLALARRADVPEPSPLYWEAMRRSVERRIAEEPRSSPRWVWLVPVLATAAAVVVVVLTTGRTHAPASLPGPTLPAWSALPPAEDDASLEVLEGGRRGGRRPGDARRRARRQRVPRRPFRRGVPCARGFASRGRQGG